MDANYIGGYVAGPGGTGRLEVRVYYDKTQARPWPLFNDPTAGACLVADNSITANLPVQVVDANGTVLFNLPVALGRTTRTAQQMRAAGFQTADDLTGLTIRNSL